MSDPGTPQHPLQRALRWILAALVAWWLLWVLLRGATALPQDTPLGYSAAVDCSPARRRLRHRCSSTIIGVVVCTKSSRIAAKRRGSWW
jgi:hypothetical protein